MAIKGEKQLGPSQRSTTALADQPQRANGDTNAKKRTKRRSKVIFKGTGLGWFAVPRYFVGDKDVRGKFFKMDPSPELRLYLILLSESSKEGNPVVTITNDYLMAFAKLNRNYLPIARKKLISAKLIRATRVGMKAHRYEILGSEGRPLWDKTSDDWGTASDFDFLPEPHDSLS